MLRMLRNIAVRLSKAGTSQPVRGKKPTKGFQQIVNENEKTISFYRLIVVGVTLLRPLLSVAFTLDLSLTGFTNGSIMSTIIIPIISFFLVVMMAIRSVPLYNNRVELKLINPGHDLSAPGGWGDNLKDGIIVLVLTHLLTVISPQFWNLLLMLPMRALYLLWIYVIRPAIALLLNGGGSPQDNHGGKKGKKGAKKPKKKLKYRRTIQHWHHFR